MESQAVMPIRSEVAERANFSTIHYAQCWEDGDIMLEALDVRPGQVCLSIASGGDNTLAMLSRGPARVIAIDVNPAQIAILELKMETLLPELALTGFGVAGLASASPVLASAGADVASTASGSVPAGATAASPSLRTRRMDDQTSCVG